MRANESACGNDMLGSRKTLVDVRIDSISATVMAVSSIVYFFRFTSVKEL